MEPEWLVEPDVYPSHFALRYKLKRESVSDPKGMLKAQEWQPSRPKTYGKLVILCGEGVQLYHGTEPGAAPGILNQGALLRGTQGKDKILGPMHSRSLEGGFHYAPFVEMDLSDYGVGEPLPPMQVVFGSIARKLMSCKHIGVITKEHWSALTEIVFRFPSLANKVQSDGGV